MVHSGYEATAVVDAITKPWKAMKAGLMGVRTEGPMAPEINMQHQRPAQYVFSSHVEKMLADVHTRERAEQVPHSVAAE
jgi:hypothetical protein